MSDYDAETGEVYSNGAAAAKAQNQAWAQKRAEDRGYGATSLYMAVAMALQKIPGVIVNDSVGEIASKKEGVKPFKYRYASMKQVVTAVRQPLLDHGVIFRHGTEHVQKIDGGILVPVYTDLIHVPSAEMTRTKLDIPVVNFTPMAVGSAVTFGKRYTLLAAIGVTTDDDDDASLARPTKALDVNPVDTMIAAIKKAKDLEALMKWRNDNAVDRAIKQLDEEDLEKVKVAFMDRRGELS